jgi:hypothetical protein
MRHVFSLLVFTCVFSQSVFSQDSLYFKPTAQYYFNYFKPTAIVLAARGGVHQNHAPYYDIGGYLLLTHGDDSGWYGAFFSIENSIYRSDRTGGKQIRGWNAGLEYDMAYPWGFRCSISGFRINDKQTLKLCPSAGLSIYCAHLFLGYNFPLTNRELIYNNGFQLSLLVGMPFLYYGFEKKNLDFLLRYINWRFFSP